MSGIDTSRLSTDAGKVIREELTALRDRIAANIIAEGSNATGKTVRSLEVEVTAGSSGVRGTLWGRNYFGALETGSRPWKNAERFKRFVPMAFADAIGEWIEAKKLDLNRWAVAKTIILHGSRLYREGGRDSIYSKEIPVYLDRMQNRLTVFFEVALTETIKINTKTEI